MLRNIFACLADDGQQVFLQVALAHARALITAGADMLDTFMYGVAKNNRLAVITSGAGTKVWFTAAYFNTRHQSGEPTTPTFGDEP